MSARQTNDCPITKKEEITLKLLCKKTLCSCSRGDANDKCTDDFARCIVGQPLILNPPPPHRALEEGQFRKFFFAFESFFLDTN